MKSKLPSRDPKLLRGLQVFDAVARFGSVSLAAQEFGVSASAISHQLRDLCETLGEELVVKNGRGIALTDYGRQLAKQLHNSFSGLDTLITGVVSPQSEVLRLAVCSSFGPSWLAPRLPDFLRTNPEIDIDLRLYSHDPEQTHAVADAFVTAHPVKPGFKSVPLFDEILVAVQSPDRAGTANAPHRARRLITTDPDEPDLGRDWINFCALSGLARDSFSSGKLLRCTHYLLAMELAKSGLGIALVPDFLAAEPLNNGSLSLFDRTRLASGRRYVLCFKESRAEDAALLSLSRWLKTAIGGDVVRLRRA